MSSSVADTARGMERGPGRQKLDYDQQERASDSQRQEAAAHSFTMDIDALSGLRIEACFHCGFCAEACPFHLATEDAIYTPIWKAEPMKQVYRREYGPFAPFVRGLGLKKKVTADQLREWQSLLYDSCTLCGRCSLICPIGVDVAGLIEDTRHAMFEAGFAPQALYDKAERQHRDGSPSGLGAHDLARRLTAIGDEHRVAIPLDAEDAEVMVCAASHELDQYPGAIAATARILDHLGVSFTYCTEGFEATNYGYLAGSRRWQKEASERIIAAAQRCGAKSVVLPESGHCYAALRWEGANLHGAPLPFRVYHVSEYLDEALSEGSLKLRQSDIGPVTFQDPCQVAQQSGVMEAPRRLLAAMGVELHEMENNRGYTICCGGGGGVVDLERAADLRRRVYALRMREANATGAGTVVTNCSDCRRSFDDGRAHVEGGLEARSLIELIADHLA